MRHMLFIYRIMGAVSLPEAVDTDDTLSAISGSARNLAGGMCLKGSYSIEALYIMGITLFVIATVLGAAYRWQEETIGGMTLHTQVEIARYQEDFQKKRVAFVEQCDGGNDWNLDITAYVPDPEEWLRMISLLDR